MKSKKAKEIMGRSYEGGHILFENAERAIEIAEADRDAKAVEAFCRACDYYKLCVETEDMICDRRIAFCKIMEGESHDHI